jgi:hypothetical protein
MLTVTKLALLRYMMNVVLRGGHYIAIVWKMEKIVIFIGLIMSIYWFMLHGLTVPAHDYI